MPTKEQIVNEVKRLRQDNKDLTKRIKRLEWQIQDLDAIWHWLKCLQEFFNKLYKQVNGFNHWEKNEHTRKEKEN